MTSHSSPTHKRRKREWRWQKEWHTEYNNTKTMCRWTLLHRTQTSNKNGAWTGLQLHDWQRKPEPKAARARESETEVPPWRWCRSSAPACSWQTRRQHTGGWTPCSWVPGLWCERCQWGSWEARQSACSPPWWHCRSQWSGRLSWGPARSQCVSINISLHL